MATSNSSHSHSSHTHSSSHSHSHSSAPSSSSSSSYPSPLAMSPSLFLSPPHPSSRQHTQHSGHSGQQHSGHSGQQQRGAQSPGTHKGMMNSSSKGQTPYTPYLPSDFSYFSPLAPESASLPPSALSTHPSSSQSSQQQTHSQSYTYTASCSSSSQTSSGSSSDSSSSGSGPNGTPYPVITATITSRSPPPTQQEMLAQFALHFPSPPALRLPSSSSSSSSSNTQPSPRSPTSPRSRIPPSPSQQQSQSPFVQQQPRISPSVPQVSSLPSPMDRSRRTGVTPVMTSQTAQGKHTLSVMLPKSISPEMVTVSANKGDRLKVVADAWHMEDDCHYEWIISFQPQDVDMSSVHAKFDPDGRLTIDVKRRIRYMGGLPAGGNMGGRLGVGYFARA